MFMKMVSFVELYMMTKLCDGAPEDVLQMQIDVHLDYRNRMQNSAR